jgi:transcriptional regulator with XRE-family HTH domain
VPEGFGARLRERREQRQVTLRTIADQTKIKLSLLEGLERDDTSRWPTGIFGRAYIRAYASAIGLDPDVVVREFVELHPQPVDEMAIDSSHATAVGPPTRLRYFVGAAIDAFARPPRSKAPKPESPVSEVTTKKGEPLPASAPVQTAAPGPVEPDPDLLSAAELCTSLSRLDDVRSATPLLEQLAGLFDATGLVLWIWDPNREKLLPTLACGYSPHVLAQLPGVRRDAQNATAAAFRSTCLCSVDSADAVKGALVVPLMSPHGCLGVLALELPRRREKLLSVRALALIVAAQLARLLVVASTVGAENGVPSAIAPEALAALRAAG